MSFEKHLVGIKNYTGFSQFNEFIFSDGSKVSFKSTKDESDFKEYKINPVDAVIKTVTLRYCNMNSGAHKGRLLAIEFFDK